MKEFKVFDDTISRYEGNKIVIHDTELLQDEAEFAFRLCQHWGMVACKVIGETEGGYNKLAVLTPEELTERSFETARLMYSSARARGLVVSVPGVAELWPDKTGEAKEKNPRKWLS